jgi:hypothetical protein
MPLETHSSATSLSRAEIGFNLAGDKGVFILCRACYSVIKHDCDIVQPDDTVCPVK